MTFFGSRFVFTLFVIVAVEAAGGVTEFRRCYNTSVEMHCFEAQYDTTNNRYLYASFESARQRCNNLNSTLLIIKDEETNNIVQNYISDPNNPIRLQYVWTDAYRINDYSNSYVWHWLNSKLPTLVASEVGYNTWIWGTSYYTTTLECRNDNGKPQFYLSAKQPQDSNSYLCEYSVSRCLINASNAIQFSDRCYISFIASVSWYEARNRCLKDGGDLASFANVTSINFTSWLGSDTIVRFWLGLRFSWYIWKDSGEDLQFTNWASNAGDWSSPCLIISPNYVPSYSWSAKDCNTGDNIYVVCHTVTPVVVITTTTTSTSVSKTTSSESIMTPSTTSVPNIHQVMTPLSRTADGAVPLGVGLGVGLGVPLIIFIILTVVFAVKNKRLMTLHEHKTHNDTTELEAVHEPSVGKVNDSANSQYQQLNRIVENSSGTTYDELRVSPETPYEEFPTQINNELTAV